MALAGSGMLLPGTGTGFDPGAFVFQGDPPEPLSEPLPNPKTGGKGECTSRTLLCKPEVRLCAPVAGLSNPHVTWFVKGPGLDGDTEVGSTGEPLMLSSSGPSDRPKKLESSLSKVVPLTKPSLVIEPGAESISHEATSVLVSVSTP